MKEINKVIAEARYERRQGDQMQNAKTNEINKQAWNAYQEDYMKVNLLERPDFYEFFANGGVELESPWISMLGDVKGLKLLDTCCACDAKQAFSWHNLGAKVTACDITPKAIEIASANAGKMNLDMEFVVADMQKLTPIADGQFDIVFATYPVWVEDFFEACRTWNRVLKKGGRLLLAAEHPISECILEDSTGLHIYRNYNHPTATRHETFDGTPAADRYIGGWSVDLPEVDNFWRISDLLNAMCEADFMIKKVHECYEMEEGYEFVHTRDIETEPQMRKLPSDFVVLAIKQ